MGYCSALNRNELQATEKTQRKLECDSLSARSQSEKATSCRTPTEDVLEKAEPWRQYRPVVARSWGMDGGMCRPSTGDFQGGESPP